MACASFHRVSLNSFSAAPMCLGCLSSISLNREQSSKPAFMPWPKNGTIACAASPINNTCSPIKNGLHWNRAAAAWERYKKNKNGRNKFVMWLGNCPPGWVSSTRSTRWMMENTRQVYLRTFIDTKYCGVALKKSKAKRCRPINSMESGKLAPKNAKRSSVVRICSKLANGMNSVTVHDRSWFGNAIIMNLPRGQMCK